MHIIGGCQCNRPFPTIYIHITTLVYFFLGWLRDETGSFSLCVHVQSALLVLAAVAWAVELILRSRRGRS